MKRIDSPSVKFEVGPGFMSRYQAWKYHVDPWDTQRGWPGPVAVHYGREHAG